MKRIPTFRPGTHRTIRGAELTFTAQELAATVAAYDPALAPAQLVKGHPQIEDPSFGQVGRFVVGDDGVLYAEDVQNLDVAFSAEVEEGRFPSRSIKFYAPGDPNNPKPGVWYPRHIGFLGAYPPALKGLPPVEFAEGETAQGAVVVAFSEDDLSDELAWPIANVFRLLKRMREWIVAEKGIEAAEMVLPASDLEWGSEDLAMIRGRMIERSIIEGEDLSPAFSEPTPTPVADKPKTDADTATTDEIKAREAELAKREAAFAEQAGARVQTEFERELDAIAAEGRLIGTDRDDIIAFCEATGLFAPGDDGAAVEIAFGEGDEARTEGALDFLAGVLRRLPVEVSFGEFAESGVPADVSDPAKVAARASAYQAEQAQKGVTVSATDAVRHVTAQAHA